MAVCRPIQNRGLGAFKGAFPFAPATSFRRMMSQTVVSSSQSQSPPLQQAHKGVALVTGAARGIGRGIALRLAEDGFDVAVNDLPGTPELDEVIKTIEGKGRRALVTPGDVSEESVVTDMIQRVVSTLGSLDVVRGAQALLPLARV